MTLTLSTIPGFADQKDTALQHDKPALGLLLSRINDNAAFGMVRLEVFTGTYINGDTVPLPVSAVDGYQYARDECYYVWAPQNTGNPKNNWASAGPPWTMWYVAYKVDQDTGAVSCVSGYRGNDDHKDRQSNQNDGTLQVWTIAQRQRSALSLASQPYYVSHSDSDFAVDYPLNQTLITDMNESAKFGAINTEVIYMGEFKHGDTVPRAISPADGHVYSRGETAYVSSLRWTGDDDGAGNMSAPDISKGQLQDWITSVNATTGVVSIQINYQLSGVHSYNTGRISVWAFCQRNGNTTPVIMQQTHASNNVGATGVTLSLANTPTPGNLLFLCVYGKNSMAYTPPAGFTPLITTGAWDSGHADEVPNTSFQEFAAYYRVVQSGDGKNYAATWNFNDTEHWSLYEIDGAVSFKLLSKGGGANSGAFSDWTWANPSGADLGKSQLVIMQLPSAASSAPTVTLNGWTLDHAASGTFHSGNIIHASTGDGATTPATSDTNECGYIAWQFLGTLTSTLTGALANAFAELSYADFMPGQTIGARASVLKQVAANIREAVGTPEFFGPYTKNNGDTIALPTSPIDGYTYSRAECMYIWTFANTGPGTDSTDRLNLASAYIDSSGVVHILQYRLASGASNWATDNDGQLSVVILAKREASHVFAVQAPVAPTNSGTTTNDASGNFQINGV